jgi:tRNA (guanine37-N1)-methyltransferase
MKITIVTLFPDMVRGFVGESIVKRAHERGQVEIEFVTMRDFATDKYGTVDDSPYGGGTGMVLKVDTVVAAIRAATGTPDGQPTKGTAGRRIVLTSARGRTYDQSRAREFAGLDHLIIVCGHYEGFDERVRDYVDEEVSLGDFIMTGGEIVAAAIMDSVVRLLPDVLKKEDATSEESFFAVPLAELRKAVGPDARLDALAAAGKETVRLLEYPHYTRPHEYEGKGIPEMLMSGHHDRIRKWRLARAYEETVRSRPDLLERP